MSEPEESKAQTSEEEPPSTLLEVLSDIDRQLTAEDKRALLTREPGAFANQLGIGLWIRNRYLYRGGGTRFLLRFLEAGFYIHEDAFSSLVIWLYRAKLSGETVTPELLLRWQGLRSRLEVPNDAAFAEALQRLVGSPVEEEL